ncbi:MAG: winged helix-turn-helix domain-containing protein [Kineosporiaceae bacterium]
MTVTAGKLLTSARAGYYDLRGRLALRTDRIVIDTVVEPVTDRHDRADALSGNAGLEVATALLMAPDGPTSVRELARALGRAPSTVSEILSALRRADLIDAGNTVTDTSLFLEVADRWATPRLHLARLPARDDSDLARPLRLGLDDVEHDTGWALTDSSAAALLGAPLALRSEQPIDFYVPDRTTARRAATLLGAAGSAPDAQCSVRVAPVPAVCRQRFRVAVNPTPWPVAHPLFVALDLAQDAGRGREILDAWTPDGRWRRVW